MSHRGLAITFTMLMLVSSIPAVSGSHVDRIVGTDVTVPVLPHVRPTQGCTSLGVGADILAALNDPANPRFFQDDAGAPALCLNGQEIEQYQAFIVQMDAILENLRNASREVQRQLDHRLEATLPDSEYPNDLLEPRTVLLDDAFDGQRYTGFGDWKVVTEGGEAPVWDLASTVTQNGTRNTYRFGSETSYERGAHQWLVSPEIDLTALKANKTAVQDLLVLRAQAHDQVDVLCNRGIQNGPGPIEFCRRESEVGFASGIVDVYEAAFDAAIDTLPVMKHGGTLDITYRMNLAPGEDGVRFWVFAGDRQPDSSVLFNPDFDRTSEGYLCAQKPAEPILPGTVFTAVNNSLDPRDGGNPSARLACTPTLEGGQPIRLSGMRETSAFRTGTADSTNITAFSGNRTEFVTQRLNLTPWMDERVWILFEVKTLPNDRGQDIFNDTARFPEPEVPRTTPKFFGFELAHVRAEGDGYHRNFRLKDIGATYPYVLPGNLYGDDRNVRTTLPPGNANIAVQLHNAGDFTENATLTLSVRKAEPAATPNFQNTGITYSQVVRLIPDEVQTLSLPWSTLLKGASLTEGWLYELTGDVVLYERNVTIAGDQAENLGNQTPSALDPNNTRVRPANAAGTVPGAGAIDLTQQVRAATSRTLTTLRADGQFGAAIQVCSTVQRTHCDEHYAARKGEPRTILTAIRNDGNTVQNVTADLQITLDGTVKDSLVNDGPRRVLTGMQPGETRLVTWVVTPTEPGAYLLRVPLIRGDDKSLDPVAERRLFVHRSTGIICLDTLEDRECGSRYEGALVPELHEENITAATLGDDGTLYVATRIAEAHPETGLHSGILAARTPEGAWSVLANLSGTRLNETFASGPEPERGWGTIRAIALAPDGSLWLAGDNGTLLRRNALGILSHLTVPTDEHIDLTAALAHDGVVLVGGTNGTLARIDGANVTRFNVTNATVALGIEEGAYESGRYEGTPHAFVHAPNGEAVLLGSDGVIMRNTPGETGWFEAEIDGVPAGFALAGRALRAATTYRDEIFVTGDDILLNGTGGSAGTFEPMSLPTARPPLGETRPNWLTTYTSLFVEHTGALALVDYEGRLALCTSCVGTSNDWSYPETARPPVVGNGPVHPARIVSGLASASATFLLGEAGLVMTLVREGEYENEGQWTTVSAYAPHDGGIIQTVVAPGSGAAQIQALMARPTGAGRDVANESEEFRLFLNHSVRNATRGAPNPAQDMTVAVRLVYLHVPVLESAGPVPLNSSGATCRPVSTSRDLGLNTVCNAERVRYQVVAFDTPTLRDGWEPRMFTGLPSAAAATVDIATPGPTMFYGLEFYLDAKTRWAIDDFHLQGRIGSDWFDVLEWRGPSADRHDAEVYIVTPVSVVDKDASARPSTGVAELERSISTVLNQTDDVPTDRWEIWRGPAFDHSEVSPWHMTTQYADRPVFAANNEEYREGFSSSTAPRLMNDWNSRLVSPVIDLRDAYDPAISFRHTYSFRNVFSPTVIVGDGGVLEVQYAFQGSECGSRDASVTCGWSPFYPIPPEGDYPLKADLGLHGIPTARQQASSEPSAIGENKSYWGRIAFADEKGFVSSPRLTDTYQEVTVSLTNTTCTATELETIRDGGRIPCVPTNLSGRQIRFAFHLVTVGDSLHLLSNGQPTGIYQDNGDWNASNPAHLAGATLPGEGWYITDFKVLGARKLGIDLEAENMTFRVGYDVDAIGVGPDTRVPINVTVRNNGTFDALGYQGRLVVRQVLNAALAETAVIDTVTLSQQPLIEAGKTANHTLYWNVPDVEGARYILDFEVDPIGIDRDEDWLDNGAHLGTIADAVPAQTVRRFNTEFFVSPENATIDITRYVPMFINNTGNVPLADFTIERRITVVGRSGGVEAATCAQWRDLVLAGRQTTIVDCREWTTQRVAPAGARTSLTALSDDVNPSSDLFWKAPERANFLVAVSAQTGTLQSGADRRVSAYATFLFDDVEGGVRGESQRGSWAYGPGWGSVQPGFRSTDSYAFGDPLIGRYSPDANSTLVSPVIDLGSARTASVAFFHKYRFEEAFDGGLLEASADGGATWTPVKALPDSETTAGYNGSFPMQASAPLHPDGDPTHPDTYAFTSDSGQHPSSVDSWVLSQFDLTDFADVTEEDVDYEAYGSLQMSAYPKAAGTQVGSNVHYSEGWCPTGGTLAASRCWTIDNLTQATRVGPGAPAPGEAVNSFWWSGSTSLSDDAKRPVQNYLLQFDVPITSVAGDHVVTADWWEYAARYDEYGSALKNGDTGTQVPDFDMPETLQSAYMFIPRGNLAQTYRFNLGEPEILETRGKWYHMRADITDQVKKLQDLGESQMTVGFAYTPIKTYPDFATHSLDAIEASYDPATGTGDVGGDHALNHDDPGFAVDALDIRATRYVRGQPLSDPLILATEESAWDGKRVSDCGTSEFWRTANTIALGCMENNRFFTLTEPIQPADEVGRNWARVTELPSFNAGWGLVDVRDHFGNPPLVALKTGEMPRAWWTGELPVKDSSKASYHKCGTLNGDVFTARASPCPVPGTESRLVTPAFDLGKVAGTDAELSFWHRFAFERKIVGSSTPLASGGVVELQEYDAQTGTWGPWKQIYTSAQQGGYNAFTANVSRRPDSVTRFDPPFENRLLASGQAFQSLYSGRSTNIDNDGDGWIRSTYDVSESIGKKVRVGFHVAWSYQMLEAVIAHQLTNPDGTGSDHGGWWVSDVSIVGKVIVGEPVQLRWRAGTDANVDEGSWQIDDIGVYGSRYSNNVGLFADETLDTFGAMPNSTFVIPITLRNLGENVRSDLAIEVIDLKTPDLTFAAPGAPTAATLGPDRFRMGGFTLGPGQSTSVDLHVSTPATFSRDSTTLLLKLKQFSTNLQQDVEITDNDVQGLLRREIEVTLQKIPDVVPTTNIIRQIAPAVGEPVDLALSFRNDGFAPATLSLTCKADTVTGYRQINHGASGPTDDPILAATYPCELVDGSLTVEPKTDTTLVFRATPTEAGFLRFVVNSSVTSGGVLFNYTSDRVSGIQVGGSNIVWKQPFDERRSFDQNFSLSSSTSWQYLRGNDAPGSMVIGIDDNRSQFNGVTYADCNVPDGCKAIGPPIDLHNFSDENPAFLSFWHMDRLARYDGARVVARQLINEQRPTATGQPAWSAPCVLVPKTGYEGIILQTPPAAPAGGASSPGQAANGGSQATPDPNPIFQFNPPQNATPTTSHHEFFTTPLGRWEEKWSFASFDLSQDCRQTTNRSRTIDLVGHTVRFEIEVFGGLANGGLRRGPGQGILIDDMVVSPLALDVRPGPASPQEARLLDNTTKQFNVIVENVGSVADVIRLEYDAANSSAPEGSVTVPSDSFTLAPGESQIATAHVKLPRDPSLLPTEFKVRLVARSATDRNAAGATTLEITFAPREWAELVVTAEAPQSIVQEGTEAFIPITIQNLGLVESGETMVRIADTWPGGPAAVGACRDPEPERSANVYCLPLAGVPPYASDPDGASRILDFAWHPASGTVGLHTLTITVDPQGQYEEYTRANNEVVLAVPVSDLLVSDLSAGNFSALVLRNSAGGVVSPAMDADVARYEVAAGELVNFELKVANTGRAGATNVDVRAFIGALSLPPKTIPYVAAGSEAVVSFNWVAQKGEHEIEFLVRSEQVELTTTNNRYPGTGVTLLTVKGYEIEVDIPDLTTTLDPGQTVEVSFSVRNAGNAGEDLVLRATSPAGTHLALPREGFFLRAGETYSDKARLVLDAEAVAGEQFISIDAVARENPMKVSTGRATMAVSASYGGSVAGGLGVGAPPGFVLPIELVNEGNSLAPWSVVVRLPTGWTSVEPQPVKVSVPAHGRTTLDLHLNVPASTAPGERVLAVKATMPNGEVREGLARTSVMPLRAAGVSVQEGLPKADKGQLTIPVVVENTGNVKEPFQVLVVDAPSGIELHVEPSVFELPPGGKAIARLVMKPNATVEAGTYAVTGYTLFDGVSPQSAEGRANIQSLKVPLVRQDLRLSPLEFSPRAGLELGDRVTVKVSVTNRGLSEVTSVPVHLFVDDVFVDQSMIDSIASGARADVTFNWTALTGTHTLTAVVDPYSDTVESDRADNAVSALASVGTDVPVGGVAAGRAKTPGFDAFALVVAALGAALLVTLSNGSRRQRR